MFQQQVAQLCLAERTAFQNGAAREWWDPQFRRVADYWRELGVTRDGRECTTFKKRSNGELELDGNGQPIPVSNNNTPWSAAFISFIARKAGAGENFHYRAYHSFYIMAALRAAATPGTTEKWIGRRRTEYTPKVGDLIACGRDRAKTATFDTAASFIDDDVDRDFFPSHTDFVVEVRPDKVVTIGGNVGNSVGLKNWVLDGQQHIPAHDPRSSTSNVIAVLECRL